MRVTSLCAALVGAAISIGCGGGGSSTSPAPTLSYVAPQAYVQDQATTALTPTTSGTVTSFSVAPALPAGLALNTSTGAISGTPTAGAAPADYTVTATGPGGSTTAKLRLAVQPAAKVTRMTVAGTSVFPLVTLDGAALGLTGTVFAKASDKDGVIGSAVAVTNSGGSYVLEFATAGSATAGVHAGQAVVSLCKDAACASPQPTSTLFLNYSLNVLATGGNWPGSHLTTLSRIPDAPEWSTFQGNAAHTGYVPVTLDPDKFDTRWQIEVPSFIYFNGLFNLGTVTTAGGNFYIAGDNPDDRSVVSARREHDGSRVWSYSFSGLPYPSVNPPAVSNGVVYVAAGQQSSTYMYALDASNGSVLFKSAMSSQWEHYLAPTVGTAGVYTNAGSYGGLYAFNAQGTQLFFAGTAQQSAWTPAVDANAVYAYTGSSLQVFDPVSGALKMSIDDPSFSNFIYEIGGSPVLGGANSVFAAAYGNSFLNGGGIGNSLLHFNLQSKTVDWSIKGVYPSTPAYDAGVVYAANNNPLRLEARSETDGSLLWSWTPQASGDTKFSSEVLLSKNLVIVSTNASTYVIDRSTHRAVWSYPASGNLALSPNGILYIVSNPGWGSSKSTITAINLH